MSEELSYHQSRKEYYKAYRETHKEEIKAYKETHKEESKAYAKRYKETHKERCKAYSKKYRETHKEELKIKQKIYDDSRKESRKAYGKRYRETHKEELKAYNSSHKLDRKIKDASLRSYERGLGYSPLNSAFLGSHIHHLHEESNTSFCVYIPSFLHELIHHVSKTGTGMQSINAVALSYWLIDYQFFKDD